MARAAKRRYEGGARLWVGLGALLLLGLGGCGGSGTTRPRSETLSADTTGLSYELQVMVAGKQLCTTAVYQTTPPGGRTVVHSSHSCGPPVAPGHPELIQARSSRSSMVLDAAPAGCGRLRAGRTRASLRPLVAHCTTGSPTFRVTVLPPVSRLVVVGLPGVPVINFPRHPCRRGVCITTLA